MKKVVLLVSIVGLVGCSALKKAMNPNPSGPNLSGSWEVVATSTQNQGVVSYVEFNATQDSSGNISAPAQEFIFGTTVPVMGNCFGVIPGNPQGNINATVDLQARSQKPVHKPAALYWLPCLPSRRQSVVPVRSPAISLGLKTYRDAQIPARLWPPRLRRFPEAIAVNSPIPMARRRP